MSLESRVSEEIRIDTLKALLPKPGPLNFSKLTESEAAVAFGLVMGADVVDIAKARFSSPHTVRNHMKSIYKKLGVSGARMLIVRYWRDTPQAHTPPVVPTQLPLQFQRTG